MITKYELTKHLRRHGNLDETELQETLQGFDGALAAVSRVSAEMPGIGFMSVQKRISAFFSQYAVISIPSSKVERSIPNRPNSLCSYSG